MNKIGKGEILLAIVLLLLFSALFAVIYDEIYSRPTAAKEANNYCKNGGYDQYKSFQRIGFLSKTPVAIKCEYSERYTDLGVRTTSVS